MEPTRRDKRFLLIVFIAVSLLILSFPAFSAEKPVGKLTSFSGKVLIKTQGEWGTEPAIGLPLYSDDKVVTRVGTATVTFNDGAVLELKNNSNLLIREEEETEGALNKTKTIQRKLRLLLGKMLFDSGESKAKTSLETATMVCGLRGTAGTLSIGADGQPYIQFTSGGPAYTVGDFISGVAAEVPQELADLNPAQRAAFVAAAAADQAKNASALAQQAAGTPAAKKAQAQAALASAKAAQLAAQEVKIQAGIIAANNPDTTLVTEANAAITAADSAISDAQAAEQDAIDAGAEPTAEPEPYQEPGAPEPTAAPAPPGFDVPVTPEPDITDTTPASPV